MIKLRIFSMVSLLSILNMMYVRKMFVSPARNCPQIRRLGGQYSFRGELTIQCDIAPILVISLTYQIAIYPPLVWHLGPCLSFRSRVYWCESIYESHHPYFPASTQSLLPLILYSGPRVIYSKAGETSDTARDQGGIFNMPRAVFHGGNQCHVWC